MAMPFFCAIRRISPRRSTRTNDSALYDQALRKPLLRDLNVVIVEVGVLGSVDVAVLENGSDVDQRVEAI